MTPDAWDRRLRRAERLEKEWPYAAEILRFFRGWTALLRQYDGGRPANKAVFHALFDFLEREAPSPLREDAKGLGEGSAEEVMAAVREDRPAARLVLWGFLQVNPAARPSSRQEGKAAACPKCGARPLLSVLREDKTAETVRRTLVCSICSDEWEFARVVCPACPEERPEKLPRYQAPEIPWVRIEACDSCLKYLKSVDLTKNPDAEPVVDELASTPLDVIAREKGYGKIVPNLAGL
jgi:FdhE protein